MATKPTTTPSSPARPVAPKPQLGTNQVPSSINPPPQKPQSEAKQFEPAEQPGSSSLEKQPQQDRQEEDTENKEREAESNQKEQEYNYILSQTRAERSQIKNAEKYRDHFQQSSNLVKYLAYIGAIVDYVLGIIEDTIIGAPAVIIQLILDLLLIWVPLHVGKNMKKMQASMEGLIQGIEASEQRQVNRIVDINSYQEGLQQTRQTYKKFKSQYQAVKSGEKVVIRSTEKRVVKKKALGFVGKMIFGDAMDLVPYVNLWPWQFRAVQKMYSHEKDMIEEGLGLVDEYTASLGQELQSNVIYADMIAEESE